MELISMQLSTKLRIPTQLVEKQLSTSSSIDLLKRLGFDVISEPERIAIIKILQHRGLLKRGKFY